MLSWVMNEAGREHLTLTQTNSGELSPTDVRVKVMAVAINYRDKLIIEGKMPARFPLIPGSDMSGVIEEVGDQVKNFRQGDPVISVFFPDWTDGKRPGSAAEPLTSAPGGEYPGVLSQYIVVNEQAVVHAPLGLDHVEASTLPCAGLTAWFALVEEGKLKAGESVLIRGTGGVALFALQIAKAMGAVVYITSTSNEKLQKAALLGADYYINSTNDNWRGKILNLTDGKGINHVIDTVGGTDVGYAAEVVSVNGNISVIGVLAGTDISLSGIQLLLKSPTIKGIGVGHKKSLKDFVLAVNATNIKPVIDSVWSFEELSAALKRLDSGPFGKVIIKL